MALDPELVRILSRIEGKIDAVAATLASQKRETHQNLVVLDARLAALEGELSEVALALAQLDLGKNSDGSPIMLRTVLEGLTQLAKTQYDDGVQRDRVMCALADAVGVKVDDLREPHLRAAPRTAG